MRQDQKTFQSGPDKFSPFYHRHVSVSVNVLLLFLNVQKADLLSHCLAFGIQLQLHIHHSLGFVKWNVAVQI